MRSSYFIHSTSLLVMMILLLLSVTDPSASSDDSLGALKNENLEPALGTTIEPSSNSMEGRPYILAELKTIIGFASSIKSMYQFFDSLLNPAITPKHTADDVMTKLDAQFTQVKGDLMEIKAKLSQQAITAYGNVELAINNALNDMRHESTIDIQSSARNLFGLLDVFLKGMLGQTVTLPDLLSTVRDHYDCGSKSMEKKMKEFIALVHVGTGGLAYYTKVINNKAIFNGENYIGNLSKNYELIRERVQVAMKSCATLDKAVINNYISKILMVNQEDHVQTGDVSKLLYKRFDDIYQPVRPDIVWVFYTAWDFKAVGGNQPAGRYAQSMHMLYQGDGWSGVTINGGWTVLWVAHPLPAPVKWLDVNVGGLRHIIQTETENYKDEECEFGDPEGQTLKCRTKNRNAYNLEKQIPWGWFYGRKPVFILILTNPPRSATMGTPLIDERMNIWQRRIDDIKWKFFYRPFPIHTFWEKVIIDFIMF